MSCSRIIRLSAVVVLAAGCRGGSERDAPAAQVDTTNADDLDGMSSQQVEAKAEALTPEQAAARGIAVDTTIHLGSPVSEDSSPPQAPAEAGKSASPPARDSQP
jgi:hypothetical protein